MIKRNGIKNTLGRSKQKREPEQTINWFIKNGKIILEPRNWLGNYFEIQGKEFQLFIRSGIRYLKFSKPYRNNKGYDISYTWRLSKNYFSTTSAQRHIYESFKTILSDKERIFMENGNKSDFRLDNLIKK